MYKLKDWININNLNWFKLSRNINAIDFLEKNLEKIHWGELCFNANPKTIHFLFKNKDKMKWDNLSSNPNAIFILEKNSNKINLDYLLENKNQEHTFIQEYYKKNHSYIMWKYGKNYKEVLRKKHNKKYFSFNYDKTSHELFNLYITNKNIINWNSLSSNPYAIDFLEHHQDKINWYDFSMNPSIFELDYKSLKERCSLYKKELIQKALHPLRIQKLLDSGISFDTLENYI